MKIKLALAALVGLAVGSLIGGVGSAYFCTGTMSQVLTGAWRDNSIQTLADTTVYLRLLDDGKTDVLKNVLLLRLSVSTITLSAGAPDISRNLLRKQIELADHIESVQNDQSDMGKMAADARKRILENSP